VVVLGGEGGGDAVGVGYSDWVLVLTLPVVSMGTRQSPARPYPGLSPRRRLRGCRRP